MYTESNGFLRNRYIYQTTRAHILETYYAVTSMRTRNRSMTQERNVWDVTPLLSVMLSSCMCVCVCTCLSARACRVTSSDTWYTICTDSWEKTWMIERSYITMQEGKKDTSYRIQFPDRWWRMTHHDGTHETNVMYRERLFECGRKGCSQIESENCQCGEWTECTKQTVFYSKMRFTIKKVALITV